MSGILIQGNTSGNIAEVNDANQLKTTSETQPFTNPGNVGSVNILALIDEGSQTGSAVLRAPEVTQGGRTRVGVDTLVDYELFNYAAQNTNKFKYVSTTMTAAMSANALTTNATGITTVTTGVQFYSFQSFPLYGLSETIVNFQAAVTSLNPANTTIDCGLMLPGAANPYAPTDGVYFRNTSSGWFGVSNFNGVEQTTSVFSGFVPSLNQVYLFQIIISSQAAEFWIDGVLYGILASPVSTATPYASISLPFGLRHAITVGAAGAVQQFKLTQYKILTGELDTNKPWAEQAVSMGGNCLSGQPGSTQGQITTYALGAAPAAVTLTASTAPATNTLGGKFLLPATTVAAESDFPLFAWLNPVGTVAVQGKTFFCDAIRVGELAVFTTLVGGPLIVEYGVGIGSTAASLATTESASFSSGTTKISRKGHLGVQALAAAAAQGVFSPGFQVLFPTPLPVQPGEYLHIIIRTQGTAITAGAARGGIFIGGHFA